MYIYKGMLSMYKHMIGIIVLMMVVVGMSMAQSDDQATFPITIEHDLGSTTITAPAQRIVALEWVYVENLLALGIMPIGVADIEGYNNWVKVAPQLDDSVIDVGTRQEPNLEVIAGLQPDLIIGAGFRLTANYDALNAIAPTITFNSYPEGSHYDEMIKTFRIMGQIVDRQADAEAVLSDMNDYFADANQALVDAGRAGETFILSQTFLSSEVPTFRLFTDNGLAVQVLEQMGLSNAWDDAPQQYGFSTVDFEAFVGIQDTNFFYIAQPDYQTTLVESPLWVELPFVLSDRAYWLGGDVWLFGGPLSMQVLTDTVLDAMGVMTILDEQESIITQGA
jgi:iron complex transport system substrate-binding protein